jgi:hypothetical protein
MMLLPYRRNEHFVGDPTGSQRAKTAQVASDRFRFLSRPGARDCS